MLYNNKSHPSIEVYRVQGVRVAQRKQYLKDGVQLVKVV